jgi:hypothetical protein
MSKEDRDRAQARMDKQTRAAQDARSGKADRDSANKAVLDNMAKLRALRLAREAAEPPRVAVTKKTAAPKKKKANEPAPALSDWLASQQNGGRRT